MKAADTAPTSVQDRLDRIAAICDSLFADNVILTPAQVVDVSERLAALQRMNDDFGWAAPYVAEALGSVERGEALSLDEHEARMDAHLAKIPSK